MAASRKGYLGSLGWDTYTWMHFKWITNKGLLYSTWNSLQHYVAAQMGGEFRGAWVHTCVRMVNPFTSPETITTLLTGCTPRQNKKF